MDIELRELKLEDTDKIVKWRNNPLVSSHLLSQKELTREQHIDYFHKYIENKLIYQFIIVADGFDCGTCFLKNINNITKTAEFGIFIGEDSFRGHGIGRIAAQKTIEFGFERLDLVLIYLFVFDYNMPAIKSYERIGFKKSQGFVDNRYPNLIKMDIKKFFI